MDVVVTIRQRAVTDTASKVGRAMAVFQGSSHVALLSNLVVNMGALVGLGLDCVLLKQGDERDALVVGLVGRFVADGQAATGAQLWSVKSNHVRQAPVIRCMLETGLYRTGEPVCMGAQTHFHADEAFAVSLPALIVSLAERPRALLAGDEQHVPSVGVLNQDERYDVDAVVRCHERAWTAAQSLEWVFKLEL
jgi:hypothetical protein